MTQIESLFEDVDRAAWRVLIEIKAGGGPFDPAGFAIRAINPNGSLVAYVVESKEAAQYPMEQLFELVHQAHVRLSEVLVDEVLEEVRNRR